MPFHVPYIPVPGIEKEPRRATRVIAQNFSYLKDSLERAMQAGDIVADGTIAPAALSGMVCGDVIRGGISIAEYLTLGAAGEILSSDGTDVLYQSLATLMESLGSTQGSILYRGAAAWAALAPGTNGHFLKTQGAAANPVWAAGESSPLTTKGDIHGYAAADARIPIGSNTHVLTADSGEALGLKWAAAGGGGGGTPPDDFDLLTDGVSSLVFAGGDVVWIT